MKPIAFARLILRMDGLLMLIGAVIEATRLGPYLGAFGRLPRWAALNAALGHDCAAVVLRMAIGVAVAAVLFGRTDAVVRLLAGRAGLDSGGQLSPRGFAVVLVRQISIWLVLASAIDATYAAFYVRPYRNLYLADPNAAAVTASLAAFVLRLALGMVAAVVIFVTAERVAAALAGPVEPVTG